jgi:hypothetical protein
MSEVTGYVTGIGTNVKGPCRNTRDVVICLWFRAGALHVLQSSLAAISGTGNGIFSKVLAQLRSAPSVQKLGKGSRKHLFPLKRFALRVLLSLSATALRSLPRS